MRAGLIVVELVMFSRSRTLTRTSQTDRTRHQIISILLFFAFQFSSKRQEKRRIPFLSFFRLPEANDDANSDDQTTNDTQNRHEKKKEIEPLMNRSIVDQWSDGRKWTNTSTVENLHWTKVIEDRA
jgi:hypothetical protein